MILKGNIGDRFAALDWQPVNMLTSKAVINQNHFVIRVKYPGASASLTMYNVFKNNAALAFNTGLTESSFKARLNAGQYDEVSHPPDPVNPVTPVNDPPPTAPGSDTEADNTILYWLIAAGLVGAVYYFKKKK